MPDVLERAVTVAAIRSVIREKLRAGISSETISFLISAYTPLGINSGRTDGAVARVSVETIPADRRIAFFNALVELPIPNVAISSRPTGRSM